MHLDSVKYSVSPDWSLRYSSWGHLVVLTLWYTEKWCGELTVDMQTPPTKSLMFMSGVDPGIWIFNKCLREFWHKWSISQHFRHTDIVTLEECEVQRGEKRLCHIVSCVSGDCCPSFDPWDKGLPWMPHQKQSEPRKDCSAMWAAQGSSAFGGLTQRRPGGGHWPSLSTICLTCM